ncbi:MAG TPA: hypothetical protein VHS96_13660 [Bacteroidia bacterium]|nr:hypothetical protein [Bacteroidia bacterium]
MFLAMSTVIGCARPSETGPEGANGVDSTANATAPAAKTGLSDTLEMLPFNAEEVPAAAKVEGKIIDGARWRDRKGENWLLISEKQHGMVADEDFTVNIYAKCFQYRNDSAVDYWEIKEFNQNVFSGPEYAKNSLEITDLDGDGLAESAFIYVIETDGAGPAGVKLLLHVKGKKYAIRGQLAGMDEDRGKVEEKRIDPGFHEIDPMFRDFASQKWDAFEAEFYKDWPAVNE